MPLETIISLIFSIIIIREVTGRPGRGLGGCLVFGSHANNFYDAEFLYFQNFHISTHAISKKLCESQFIHTKYEVSFRKFCNKKFGVVS